MHGDPIGYFLTWVTHGTWLPGDARGWVEYRAGWQLPDPVRELEAKALMTEDACILTREQRRAVEVQIAETFAHRGWTLHAVNCRSNRAHVAVTGRDPQEDSNRPQGVGNPNPEERVRQPS